MIIIDHKPAEADALIKEYPKDSVERDIIQKAAKSEEEYAYDSIDQFKFELRLRKEIVKSSVDLYKSRLQFKIFRESKCNEDYWNRTNEGGFVLRKDAKPSEAINDIYENGRAYGTECATAMMIVYYKALLNIYEEALFDKTFPKIHLMNWHYIDRILKEVTAMKRVKDYLPGDRRYFNNPDVDPETPEWQGENAIDLNGKLYYGHGIGIHSADTIIKELNKNRREGADESAYLMDSAGRPNFKKLAEIYYKSESS